MERPEELFARLQREGETAIDQMIADRASEAFFLDFKRSGDNGGGARLHQDDRNNLAKAISGFGNSEGGVIIWGVDCRNIGGTGDVARAKFPITDTRRFVSLLNGAISGCTLPAHSQVQSCAIDTGTGTGYVATLIPRSPLVPHQAISTTQYYMRAGSDFVPVPHGVLMGMLGRPPHPVVRHQWETSPPQLGASGPKGAVTRDVTFEIGVLLRNMGPGIAKDLYLNVILALPEGSNSRGGFTGTQNNDWAFSLLFGLRAQMIAREGYRLAPEAYAQPVSIVLTLQPPFIGEFIFDISYGHGTSPVTTWRTTVPATRIDEVYQLALQSQDHDAANQLVRALLDPDAIL